MSNEDIKELMKERDKVLGILDKAQAEIEKVKDIIPRNVFDPIKWLKKYRPDLAKNTKLIDALTLAMSLSEKENKRRLRKKTFIEYKLEVNEPLREALVFVIEYYVKDYCGGELDSDRRSEGLDFQGKLLKGLYNSYMLYYGIRERSSPLILKLRPSELASIFVAFTQVVEDATDFPGDFEYEVEKFKTLKNFVGSGSIRKIKNTMIPKVTEDGSIEFEWETKEEDINLSGIKKAKEIKQ